MHKLGMLLVALCLVLVGAITFHAPAGAQVDPPAGAVAPTSLSPGKAAALSIIPGLGQHQMGEHRRAYLMEAAFLCGGILYATGGSKDGGGSYTPPEYTPPPPPAHGAGRTIGSRAARLFRASGSGDGTGNGDGSGGGSSTGRKIGIGFMAASAVWSVIDAPRTAKRLASERPIGANSSGPESAGVRLAFQPSWDGLSASVSLRF